MDKSEPPSPEGCNSTLFLVGKNSHGNWVVQGQSGLRGGLFMSRADALKFAMFESGNPQAVIMVPGVFELDMSVKSPAGQHSGAMAPPPVHRAA